MDYAKLILHLLPRGDIWPQESGEQPIWDEAINALAAEPQRIADDASRIADIWIDIPTEYLDDFERLLGLSRGILSDSARRSAINTQLALNNGISFADIQALAAVWSATVTQHEYTIFIMNVGAMGDALRSEQWLATYTITYTGPQNLALEAAMRAVAPPNNTVLFVVV